MWPRGMRRPMTAHFLGHEKCGSGHWISALHSLSRKKIVACKGPACSRLPTRMPTRATAVLVWPVRTGTVRLCGVASSSYIRTVRSHVRHTTYEYSCMLLACWPAGHPTVHGSPLQQHGRCRGHTAVIACCCTGGRRPPAGRSPPLCGTSPLQVSKVTAMSTTTTTATTTAAGGATTTVTTTTTAPEDPALFHGGNPELA
jgi:hypothetical protein